ncbi:hypothetical protein ACETRX_00190 [Labrys portucalensis]|uniref:Secreted protein n=1 Tax=Labrys neptuniae TaxID=376174 RepID=A0ABV6Z755_9HYPH
MLVVPPWNVFLVSVLGGVVLLALTPTKGAQPASKTDIPNATMKFRNIVTSAVENYLILVVLCFDRPTVPFRITVKCARNDSRPSCWNPSQATMKAATVTAP